MDKAITDSVHADSAESRKRAEELRKLAEENRKQNAQADQALAREPDLPDYTGPDSEDDDAQAKNPAAAPAAAGTTRGPRSPSERGGKPLPPPPADSSADAPKVAFEPMPDEIYFDGEPTPTPKPKRGRWIPAKRKK